MLQELTQIMRNEQKLCFFFIAYITREIFFFFFVSSHNKSVNIYKNLCKRNPLARSPGHIQLVYNNVPTCYYQLLLPMSVRKPLEPTNGERVSLSSSSSSSSFLHSETAVGVILTTRTTRRCALYGSANEPVAFSPRFVVVPRRRHRVYNTREAETSVNTLYINV